ncbi:lipoxygenase [Gymnopilus junonius]|uniref:Manganese lipoxygenase n=1 Tax=Gymnopilus junonius TaxID=109634 RepID=A0A9P5NT83_GYMJU|nr:lipoxygenase [Gymnopilus junonius]
MFRNLCGSKTYKNIVVLTTFWDQLASEQEGLRREEQLESMFFKDLVEGGALFMRHDRTIKKIRIEGKVLEDTAAGSVHREEVEKIIAKYKQEVVELKAEIEALKQGNISLRKELEEERAMIKEKGDLKKGLEEQRQDRERLKGKAVKDKEDREKWQSEQERAWADKLDYQAKEHEEVFKKLQMELEEAQKVMARRDSEIISPPPPYEAEYSAQDQGAGYSRGVFQFAHTGDYPPYLKSIPKKHQTSPFDIFDFGSFAETTAMLFVNPDLLTKLRKLAPDWNTTGTMQDLVSRTSSCSARRAALNVGHREDWYTDEVFAQQQFTGTNPTTIKVAPKKWVESFKKVAVAQRRGDVVRVLEGATENVYIQDYSDFRDLMGVDPREEFMTEGRYGCSSVALFHLEAEGKLHPLAITLDYVGTMEESVTIFNRRTTSKSPRNQADDWPWRYAKMCAQVSDWMRHEVAIHLVNTHLVEEVIIVAAHRTFDPTHIIFKLLEPHWTTTLSLNKSARETLVPKIINRMTGFTPEQTVAFLNASYNEFDWTGLYVPNDLHKRGFPNTAEELDGLKFVTAVLKEAYPGGDAQVTSDSSLLAFCQEVRSFNGGRLSSFPASLQTLDELIDFVTMCIHTASPQHTAVNYLQQYYQTFVPNKPSALYSALPKSLEELNYLGEVDLLLALPIHQPRDWLFMAQVPYLLSFEVPDDNTILHYATTTSDVKAGEYGVPEVIRRAAKKLKEDLEDFIDVVENNSRQLDDQKTPYVVLDPSKTAISILI